MVRATGRVEVRARFWVYLLHLLCF